MFLVAMDKEHRTLTLLTTLFEGCVVQSFIDIHAQTDMYTSVFAGQILPRGEQKDEKKSSRFFDEPMSFMGTVLYIFVAMFDNVLLIC